DFYWDLANARAIIDARRSLVDDAAVGAVVDRLVERIDRQTVPRLASVRKAIIHGDLNDANLLVGGGTDLETRNQSVVGIVDFGDMVYSYRVGELAVGIAYPQPDPA